MTTDARGAGRAPRARTATIVDDPLGGTVRRTVLPNGLRILTEAVPAMRSVSLGIWVGVGSRDETRSLSGVSHFLEHLLFKGTPRRSALEISSAIEAVGGETNAFTAREYTCYYARVLDADLPLAIDVLCDLLADSVLAPADVETERGVILEEIAMHDDEPDDEVHDLFGAALYGDHALGRLISGTEETISALTRRQIYSFYERRYRPPTMVVAAAGGLEHQQVVKLVSQAFARASRFEPIAPPAPRRPAKGTVKVNRGQVLVRDKDTEQAHVVLGGPAPARDDPNRFALGVLNNALGGGMSSRLFQEIRERRGLAYSVYSFTSHYADAGYWGVYAGCAPGKVEQVLTVARQELARVATEGLRDDEVARGQGMYKGALVLALEDTGSRMSRLGKGELLYGDVLTVDQLLAHVDAVTPEQVRALAAQLLTGTPALAVVGPFKNRDFTAYVR